MTKNKKNKVESGYVFLPPVIHERYAFQLPVSWSHYACCMEFCLVGWENSGYETDKPLKVPILP